MMQNKSSGLSVAFHWNPVRSSPVKTFPRSRCKHASCLHNYFVYIVGGKDGNVSLKDVWRINIGTSQWEQLNYRGDKLPYLEGHTIVSHKRLMLLFGGGFGDDVDDSALWIINPDLQHIRKHWNETGIPQPCNRRYHSCVVYNSTLYIYGGYVDLKGSSSELWAFHIDDEEWEQVIPRQKTEYTAGSRHGHSAVLYGRDMWVFGGSSDLHCKSDLWKYNFHSRMWNKCKLRFGPPAKTGHSACVVKDCMIIFGGENDIGMLTNDIWVFSFCSLRWSHIQLSSVSPSPRLWHTIIPVTTIICKGDNSVRTSSMPYLQKKGTASKLQRPKSSPAYSSTRNRVRPESPDKKNNRPKTLDVKSFHNNSGNSNTPIAFPLLSKTPPKLKEDKSPLLDKRSNSNTSILSSSSQAGVDNPSYERSISAEKLPDPKRISGEYDLDDGEFEQKRTRYSDKDTSCLLESKRERQRIYLRKGEKKAKSPEQVLPGQVFPSRFLQKYTVTETYIPLEDLTDKKKDQRSPEFVVEDLEIYESWFCKDFTPLVPKNMADCLNLNSEEIASENAVEMKAIKPHGRNVVRKRLLSVDDKSKSTNDLFETSLISSDSENMKKCSSLVSVQSDKRQTMQCWNESDNSETTEILPQIMLYDKSVQNNKLHICQNLPKNSDLDTKTSNSQNSQNNVTDIPEVMTPYVLLFGGKEIKGSNLHIEPISVWKCDVLLRHSDISHGEYHKSSLVV